MTHLPLPGDNQRRRIERELVDMLAAMPLMGHADSRRQMVQRLRRELHHGDRLDDVANPRGQSLEIANACLGEPPEVDTLVELVRLFDPAADELPDLERLRYEADAIGVLADSDWAELRTALLAVRLAPLTRLLQRASEHKLASLPPWCANAWDVFVYLTGQNAPPRGLPPGMLFLALLENEVDSGTATLIRRRNRQEATSLGLTEELDRRRVLVNAGGEATTRYAYLVIQIENDLEPGSERYTVSHYRQWHGGGEWNSKLRGRIPEVGYDDLESTVEQIVHQMEVEWADRPAEVAVELVLPIELLNEDVPWWRKERASQYLDQKVLAMDYPVVVRSLDRLRTTSWRRAWLLRWDRLQAEPWNSGLYRSAPDGPGYLTRMEADLNSDQSLATVVLSAPPTTDAEATVKEIMTALRAGLPVVVWHRTAPTDTDFWDEIRSMTARAGVVRLPELAKRSRLSALQAPPPEQERHHGRHLVVLWDDPYRTPELDTHHGTPEVTG
ncbi:MULTISPECIES: hypothetical protein [unclassified Micromonospora]|uniref:VMAP-C domain-containing protein n=1 Tax=unclassified Micromonospora TaxID=2617518 RepID=UPI0010333572|nr:MULTISPECIES: hypothetical protein [unclassified Micromonospora]QKW12473.1 hypothetical protein HUT12_06440 [Verrucosispora sp. NA02020]TBL42514.1 hypothetical protein EYA84_03920 [Verrucosispora sp. SN26_14.1]